MKSLNRIIRNATLNLIVAGLAGSFSLNGCAPELQNLRDSDIMSVGMAAYLGLKGETLNPEQRAALIAGSQLTAEAGNRAHELDVAREGKPELNVNIGTSQNQDLRYQDLRQNPQYNYLLRSMINKSDAFFACYNWEDRDNDGIITPSEFNGLKTTFTTNENFYLLASVFNKKGSSITLEIIDPTGKRFTASKVIDREQGYVPFGQFCGSKLIEGTYDARWYEGGKRIGENAFRIISEQSSNMDSLLK